MQDFLVLFLSGRIPTKQMQLIFRHGKKATLLLYVAGFASDRKVNGVYEKVKAEFLSHHEVLKKHVYGWQQCLL